MRNGKAGTVETAPLPVPPQPHNSISISINMAGISLMEKGEDQKSKEEVKVAKDPDEGTFNSLLGPHTGRYFIGIYDRPLSFHGCGIGWFLFVLGFVFPPLWYYATFLYFRDNSLNDPRERAGLGASAIAVEPSKDSRVSMTVDAVKESEYRDSHFDFQKFKKVRVFVPRFTETTKTMREFPHSEVQSKRYKLTEDDQEREMPLETNLYKSFKSGEKVESWKNNIGFVHNQILKIREEDSHLGVDIKEKLAVLHLSSRFILSRPILPCSHLGKKTAIKTRH
ncbi:hypothetical protein NE237_011044 [Protea cynaroides]|uniref:Uncharacterized protein n=1 Tax=Protea cynaroides TaxID=273540 RepID=A0A9Q0GU79_9MAGN|nr:hypothetical protein NE237_011044 [Protea cynaroides]